MCVYMVDYSSACVSLPCPPLSSNLILFSPSSGLLSPPLACNPSHLSPALDCCVHCNPLHLSPGSKLPCPSLPGNPSHLLWTAVSVSAVQSFSFVSQLWTAVSASVLQSFSFVSQLWAAVSASALESFKFVSQLWIYKRKRFRRKL